MKEYLASLKPQERRGLAAAGVVVFLMLNYFFVWPHFHDWARSTALMAGAEKTNAMYNAELRHKDEYTRKINELQSDGSSVLPEDQAIDFVHFYNSRAISNKIIVVNQGALVTHTNEFFLEQQMGITVQADETNLVKFLYSLGAGNSMMRVRAMSLHPNPDHHELSANLTLVASYQKKAGGRGPATPVRGGSPVPTPTPRPVVSAPPMAPPVKPAASVTQIPERPTKREHTNRLGGAFSRMTATNKPGPL